MTFIYPIIYLFTLGDTPTEEKRLKTQQIRDANRAIPELSDELETVPTYDG